MGIGYGSPSNLGSDFGRSLAGQFILPVLQRLDNA